MQRIQNITDWKCVEHGGALNLKGGVHRRIRLDVNAPGAVVLNYVTGDGEVTFLARVLGRDVIELWAGHDEFAIVVDGGECWFQSVDGEDFSFSIPDAETITRIVTRRPRNHELELMNYTMQQNMERRYAQMREDMEREWARRAEAPASAAAQPKPASDDGAVAGESKPAASAGDDTKPAKADGGDGSKPAAKG